MKEKKEYKVVFDTKMVSIGIFVVLVSAALILLSGLKPINNKTSDTTDENSIQLDGGDVMENTDKLKIEDLKVGDGDVAVSGKSVVVNYTGMLTNGKKFDSSYDRGTPFKFDLGAGDVIPGWDEGVVGMKVGGKRKLTIPPDLGYGAKGTSDGSIPPNSTLVFEIELLSVE